MYPLEGLIPVNKWFKDIHDSQLIISGPCSAESREQIMDTARKIIEIPRVKIFRAGVWKPRTRPGHFEGVGKKGLKWLAELKEKTGLRFAVEVADPRHLSQALKYGADLIWIGARTTSNPFSVQALADQIKGRDIPVLIKNPINPDLSLWIGALERFHHAGVRKLAAVHRGFYPFEQTKLRNIPKWEIPIELKTKHHDLPIFCDPSHIAGNPEYIKEISQKALDLNMNGLMIEAHINPSQALSDPQQQVTPSQLKEIIDQLVFRTLESKDSYFKNILESYREKIDSIDEQIVQLLAQRMDIVEEIGRYKSKKKVTIFQLRRWEKIISSRISQGMSLGLSEEFIKHLLQLVHKESIRKQNQIMNEPEQKDIDND